MLTSEFWSVELLKMTLLGGIAYLCGLLVLHREVKVNYTRKINFFALYLVPFMLDGMAPAADPSLAASVRAAFLVGMMAFFVKPVRERIAFAGTMFLSYDRPEDRPHTMFWLVTQLFAGYAVLIPMESLFTELGIHDLILIPILVHGLGDGLAEPVGVRFGRHKYTTRAFCCQRRYTRSVEGSACVYLAGVVAVAWFHAEFSLPQFLAALAVIPIGMTLAEALSPHTWDTPLMFLTGTTCLIAITQWV